jgi:peroxiredoxin
MSASSERTVLAWTRSMISGATLISVFAACGSMIDPRTAVLHRSYSDATVGAPFAVSSFAQTPPATPTIGLVIPGSKAELGEIAPDFTLNDLAGKPVSLSRSRGKIVVLEWMSPACEHCRYAYDSGPLKTLPADMKRKGVVWLTINSELPDQRAGNIDFNRDFMTKHGSQSPLLFDRNGEVARAYGVKTTPHLFVINQRGKLVYRGALDNAPLGKVSGDISKTNFVEAAVADLKSGHTATTRDTRPYGCPVRSRQP